MIETKEEESSVEAKTAGENGAAVEVRSDSPLKSDSQVPKLPQENGKDSCPKNGKVQSKEPMKMVANRQESYDDSMNPFADDEDD